MYMLLMYLVKSCRADTTVRPCVILRGVDVLGVDVAGIVFSDGVV